MKALKEAVDLPIDIHTHYTSGVASMTYLKAVEAGADMIDTAMSPFSMGTSQPATEVMVETFKGTPYDTGLDQEKLAEIADYFRPMREEALKSGLMNTKVLGVDINTLRYQVPGGMLSNLVSQLKEARAEDKYYDVLKEIPRVRKDFGEPPLSYSVFPDRWYTGCIKCPDGRALQDVHKGIQETSDGRVRPDCKAVRQRSSEEEQSAMQNRSPVVRQI